MKTLLTAALLAVPVLLADTGVLIPTDHNEPDPSVFSLNEMGVYIRIDNGIARVQVRQIFANHTGEVHEGTYQFALPSNASISDFAVWDDVTRIPGVILERRRAGEIYDIARSQAIDPGLLQMGERDASEAARSSMFTAKIAPIPAFGTKRVEMEYQQPIAVDRYQSEFVVPLKPDVYSAQTAGHLTITFDLESDRRITAFTVPGDVYTFKKWNRTDHRIQGTFYGDNVALNQDFAVRYTSDPASAGTVRVITQREDGEGFFGASALLPLEQGRSAQQPPRTVIALFDASLSMQWDKLERSFQALDTLLHNLRPADSFNLLLFNSGVTAFAPAPKPATIPNVEQALAFVRNSGIRGGSDIQEALEAGLAQIAGARSEPYIVLISDGGATEGTIHDGKLAAWYSGEWKKIAAARRPRTFVFGVGDDANEPLLRMLAANRGVLEIARSTEPLEFKLNAFLARIGRLPVTQLALATSPASNFELVYPLEDVSYGGAMANWVGQYKRPLAKASFTVTGSEQGRPLRMTEAVALPARATDHPYLPRTWARARVDALLAKIARDGEDRATIDEIIRLSKKYKFVTPYTSFLAVPRALLRPRVIRPGDPVLRVKTDPSIASVIALFPFGLVKPLRYLKDEDAWQTRFLAPPDMNDGAYKVRLVLRDRAGRVYRESKSFVIASKSPVVTVKLDKLRVRRGDTVRIAANATGTARTIVARLYGAAPVFLHWSSAAKANIGALTIPADLPPGKYQIAITAEDIAHNIGAKEAAVEIW